MADEERESYTVVVDADGRVSLHLDSGAALRIGRIEDYPALRRKLGDEGVLDAVRGAVGDDVNVRRAAPGETDNSADVGDGADTRVFDIPGLGNVVGNFVNAFRIWRKKRKAKVRGRKRRDITRGETLTVDAASPNAVELALAQGTSSKKVPVVDGKARIDAETSNDMTPGLWKTTWQVEEDGEVKRLSGPKIKVAAAAGDPKKSFLDSFGGWLDEHEILFHKTFDLSDRVRDSVTGVFRDRDEWIERKEERKEKKRKKKQEKKEREQRVIAEARALAAEGLSKTDAARQLGVAPTKFISMVRRHLPDLEWHDGRGDGRGGRKK